MDRRLRPVGENSMTPVDPVRDAGEHQLRLAEHFSRLSVVGDGIDQA